MKSLTKSSEYLYKMATGKTEWGIGREGVREKERSRLKE
jgi:hypothetical protein